MNATQSEIVRDRIEEALRYLPPVHRPSARNIIRDLVRETPRLSGASDALRDARAEIKRLRTQVRALQDSVGKYADEIHGLKVARCECCGYEGSEHPRRSS